MVEEEAPHENQETDDLRPVFPDNDYTIKQEVGFCFFKISAFLHQGCKNFTQLQILPDSLLYYLNHLFMQPFSTILELKIYHLAFF